MIYHLILPIINIAYNFSPCSAIIISAVDYRKTFFPKPDLTRTLVIPTYNYLHQIKLDLKFNALYVHSNLGGTTHGHIGLLMTNTNYATLSNFPYVCTVHPGILQIPNNATRVASYKLNRVYYKNLQVFHELCGVKQAIIQQFFTAIDEQYIISMNNRAVGQFTGNMHHIFAYLLAMYGKISLSRLNDFKKEVT